MARRPGGRAPRRRVARGPDRARRRLAHAIVGARGLDARRHTRRSRSSGDCERARRGLLGLCSDRCRAALACETQRSCRALESRGAGAVWEACCERRLVALIASLFIIAASPEPRASDLHTWRAASGRRLHTEPHAWPDGGDPRQSAGDPDAGQRQAWFDLTTWRLEDYLNLQSFAASGASFRAASRTRTVRSTNAPMPISPLSERSSCSWPGSPAPITNRSMR